MTKPEYGPVGVEDDEDFETGPSRRVRTEAKPDVWKTVLWVQIANFLVLLLIIAIYLVATKKVHSVLNSGYTVSQTFAVDKSDLKYVKSGPFADSYWHNITFRSNNGLVVLPTTYAKAHNLPLSGLPAPSGKTIFQVDVFHQIHCLERIRGFIVSAPFLYKLNPNRTEEDEFSRHILHCVDYLRQAIMCNADTTLVSTTTDLEFDKSPPRMCRDFGKVRDWVMENRYDYNKWLNGVAKHDAHTTKVT